MMSDFLTPIHIIFYVFATLAIGSGIAVISARNPVRSVLSLVVTFFSMAGVWMILRAEFLSLILLLVYVGAVMTLFLFVVMMLNIDKESKKGGLVRYFPFALLVVLLVTGLTITALGPNVFGFAQMPLPAPEPADYSNVQQLGTILYTKYAYPFEIAGVLLLTAIIAAITLTHRRGPLRRKSQNPADQVAVRPQDRLRIVKMPAETKQESA